MALEIHNDAEAKVSSNSGLNKQINLTGAKKFSAKDRMFFIEQLAMMLETGSDLHSSLVVLQQQSENPAISRVLEMLCDDISEGKSFSSSLSKHPQVFSTTYVGLIEASESGGYLRDILEHLLDMEKQREELHSTLSSAAAYPVFLMFFSFAMVVFILAVVFPKFADMFTSIQDQLPASTLFLMGLSHIIIDYWWALILAFSLLVFSFISWLKSESGSMIMGNLKLKTPVIKTIFIKLYLIQTMRVLGLSLSHGVNLIDALELAKDVVKNRVFNDFLDRLINDVNEGRTLATGFNKTDFIPPLVRQMITTGEESGNLALVSIRIADYFQKELEKMLHFLTKVIEPVMLIIMGVIVGILVSSLILPIFKLSHAVH